MRHSSYLEIDLNFLDSNIQKIQKLAPHSKILPMVKADAYGNGLVPIAQFLSRELNHEILGVATLGEALHLIQNCPTLKSEIYVFSDTELLNEKAREAYLNFNITPVLHQKSDLDVVLKDPSFKHLPLVIKINTGMNRLGLSLEELEEVAPLLKNRGVKHLMSHLACSYYVKKAGDKTERQLLEFEKAKSILKTAGVSVESTSISNSGAIEQGIGTNETFVRPGLMMYGPYSVEPRIWDGAQISRLVTKAMKTMVIKRGTPVGYGINVTNEDTFIVVIPLGYGDGLMTFASGINLNVNGIEGKLFARVNMDMAFLAFGADKAGKIKQEDSIEIWSHDNRVITDIATQMKTIPYQIMCGISGRIPRIYKVK
ncbi:MAG: alanine racemase [Bacteriovoracaceae bacterium]